MLPAPDPTQRKDEVCTYRSRIGAYVLMFGWIIVTGVFLARGMFWYWIAWMLMVWLAAFLLQMTWLDSHQRKCGKVHHERRR